MPMYTILVPVDGSSHALKALHIAGDLAGKYNGRIALLHVLARNKRAGDFLKLGAAREFGPKLIAALEVAAKLDASGAAAKGAGTVIPDAVLHTMGEKILAEAEARTVKRSIAAEKLAIEDGDPCECILLAARKANANIIVMGCRGVTSAKGGSFGSVSQEVFEKEKAECTCISVK